MAGVSTVARVPGVSVVSVTTVDPAVAYALLVLVSPCSFMLVFAVFPTAGLTYVYLNTPDVAAASALNVVPIAFLGISAVRKGKGW